MGSSDLAQLAISTESPTESLETGELYDALEACLAELTERQRRVLQLRIEYVLTARLTAEALGVSKPTVGREKTKGLNRLKECLSNKGFER